MNLNFPLVLVIATAVCGVVWLLDSLLFAGRRRRRFVEQASLQGQKITSDEVGYKPLLVEYAQSFFPVLLIVLVLRSFIFEPFRIPSGSMIPTLLIGDFILVNKFSYGVRLPVIHTKILATGSPKRGDVAVFRYPIDPSLDYIKRVVGLPGDTVEYRDNSLFINGEQVKMNEGDFYVEPHSGNVDNAQIEKLEDLFGVEHRVLISSSSGLHNKSGSWKVPEGQYFFVGDNRDNSNDSRYWGTVPEENLVGKAFFIWMNFSKGSVLWSRIGDTIK